MSGTTPAYQYGVVLGTLQRGVEQMFQQIAEGMRAATTAPTRRTPEQREALRELAYRRRIAAEREAGLRFVRLEAARVRRELGLPQVRR